MSELHIQCPQCQAIFRLSPTHLERADTRVRCRQCRHIFDAAQALLTGPIEPVAAPTPVPAPLNNLPPEEESALLAALAAEEQAQLDRRRRQRGNLGWGLLGLLLVGGLVGQYYWFERRDFVLQHPQLRPWLETACSYLHCTLPTTRNLGYFSISKNLLDRYAEVPDAVQLQFMFENQAPFPQPYPGLSIGFEDENRHLVGIAHLKPAEYLPADTDHSRLLPNIPVHVNVRFKNAVPHMHTYGYVINFL